MSVNVTASPTARLYSEIAGCIGRASVLRLKFIDCAGGGGERLVDHGRVFEMLRRAEQRGGGGAGMWASVVYYDSFCGLPAAEALGLAIDEVERLWE